MKPLPHEYEACFLFTLSVEARQVLERSKKACLISASLAVPVCLQPNIVEA